jgi:hypothetical protein
MKVIQNSAIALLGMASMVYGLVARSAGTANDVVSVVLALKPTGELNDTQKAIFPDPDYLNSGLFVTGLSLIRWDQGYSKGSIAHSTVYSCRSEYSGAIQWWISFDHYR